MYSPIEENYLKAIYLTGLQADQKVSITILAASLSNNPASVIEMIKKLTDKKLIKYNKIDGVKLTNQGVEKAIQMVRKHRLWETFLKEKLGYTWDEVHDIAEQMEHVQDETLADRLDSLLGFPQFDPHGEPIPASDGKLPESFYKTLFLIDIGIQCQVVLVKDTSKIFLQYLHLLNITIGTTIKVIDKTEFDGSMSIIIGESNKTIVSEKFAKSICVS